MEYIAEFGFHWFWFAVASLLLIIEVMHGRFILMAVSFAAVVVGGLSGIYPGMGFELQGLILVILAPGFIWISQATLKERMQKIQMQQDILKNRSYVGRVMNLVSGIESGHSSMNIDGMVWTIQGQDCPAGSQVKVVDMGAGWLKVEPA